MTKKLLFSAVLITATSVLFSPNSYVHSNSQGAPAGRTGAPRVPSGNEATCAASGCHGSNLNNGPNSAGISIADNPTGFDPGVTYSITARINNPVGTAGGFQLVCLDPNRANAGIFTAGTGNKRIASGGRFYMTHNSRTNRSWTFTWQAPADAPDSVTFYMAAMETVSGVFRTYTTSYVFRKNVVTSVAEEVSATAAIQVFPTQVSNQISVRNPHFGQLTGKVLVVGMDGRLVQEVQLNPASDLTEVALPQDMKAGLYNLQIVTSKGIETRRFQKL
jgi:hypothetical protein